MNMVASDDSESERDEWVEDESGPEGSGVDDDPPDRFCAICDNGGLLLCCDGKCLRSFHATAEHGLDSMCESLGLSNEEFEVINHQENFHCANCQYSQHQCFVCGELGSSDKAFGAEVFQCSSEGCGHFYHSRCVAKLVHCESEAEAEDFHQKIVAGEPFTCPSHKCVVCKQGENWVDHDLQFWVDHGLQLAMCRRCPTSYHRKCLPSEIVFNNSKVEGIPRAWEGLLPRHRISIYCLKHDIDAGTGTPNRNHIKFPKIGRKKQASRGC